MRIAVALAFILFPQLFSLPVVQGEEFPPPRLIRRNEIITPPSSGPVKKRTVQPRVLDLQKVEQVEFTDPAPVPEITDSVLIEEFLGGAEVNQPRKFPAPVQQQATQLERNPVDWQQPVLKMTPNWSSSSKTKSAQELQYETPRQDDVWESASSSRTLTTSSSETKTASLTEPREIPAPPPPLDEMSPYRAKMYYPTPAKTLPTPELHRHGAWQPIDSMTEESLFYHTDSYYESSPYYQSSPPVMNQSYAPMMEECETCWQDGDVWIEEGDIAQACNCHSAFQSDFSPVLMLGAKGGNDRSLGEVGALLPLWQSDYDLFFGEIQGRFSDTEENEGHFGLGFRTYFNDDWIVGTYAFYDLRKTSERNRFNQLTVGLELMSPEWDFRINGYFPNEGAKSSPLTTGISNGTISTNNFQERASRGFNVEIGRRILRWGRFDTNEVRWFAGYYSLDSKASGFRKIDGPRTRVEYRSYDLPFLGPQSRLTAGLEYSNDNLRDDQYWGYLRVQIPLAPRANRTPLDPLRRRFMDPTVRGID